MKQTLAILTALMIAATAFADGATRTGIAIRAVAFNPAQAELLATFTAYMVQSLGYTESPIEIMSTDENNVPNGVRSEGSQIWVEYTCPVANNPIRDFWIARGVSIPEGKWYVYNRRQNEVGQVGADIQLVRKRRIAMEAWMEANPNVKANVKWVSSVDPKEALYNMTGMVEVQGDPQ